MNGLEVSKVSKVSGVFSSKSDEIVFTDLCQNVMTGKVKVKQVTFKNRVIKSIQPIDPVTKYLISDNVEKLYAFLTTMTKNPARGILAQAMTKTFLEMVKHPSPKDFETLLEKHNYAYVVGESDVPPETRMASWSDEEVLRHLRTCTNWPQSWGYVSVLIVYSNEGMTKGNASNGVLLKIKVPFPSPKGRTYVDITGDDIPVAHQILSPPTTRVFTAVDANYKFIDVPKAEIFGLDTSIGKVMKKYYSMWRVTDMICERAYRLTLTPQRSAERATAMLHSLLRASTPFIDDEF